MANYENMQVDFRSDSIDVDTNFGAWGGIAGGSQAPPPPPTGGGGGGSGGGTDGGGGSVPVNSGQQVDWRDNQGCVAGNTGATWTLLLILLGIAGTAAIARKASW